MHIAHILSGDIWGGAETQLYTLVKALRSMDGITTEALLFNDGLTAQRLRECGIAVTVLSEARHGPLALLRKATRWLRRARPDIVHTHGYKECIVGSVAALLAGGIPRVRTVHGWVETRTRFWQVKKLLTRLAELAVLRGQQAVVAVSAELGDRLVQYVKHDNVVVIESGVDIDGIEAAAGAPNPAPHGIWRIAIVGRLVSVKRIDLFLQTCRLLRDEYGARFRALIIGDGPQAADIQSQANQLGLEQQTELRGFVGNVPQQLRNVDALLITSDHEGLPMTLLEAMALKVPIVAHAVGGIPAALAEGRCGWLVYGHDPQSYYASLQEALHDKAEASRRVMNAYERVISHYSAVHAARRYCDMYRRIVTHAGRGGGIAEL